MTPTTTQIKNGRSYEDDKGKVYVCEGLGTDPNGPFCWMRIEGTLHKCDRGQLERCLKPIKKKRDSATVKQGGKK